MGVSGHQVFLWKVKRQKNARIWRLCSSSFKRQISSYSESCMLYVRSHSQLVLSWMNFFCTTMNQLRQLCCCPLVKFMILWLNTKHYGCFTYRVAKAGRVSQPVQRAGQELQPVQNFYAGSVDEPHPGVSSLPLLNPCPAQQLYVDLWEAEMPCLRVSALAGWLCHTNGRV